MIWWWFNFKGERVQSNNKHLLGYWAAALVLIGLLLFGLIAAVRRGDYVPVFGAGGSLIFVVGLAFYTKYKVSSLFRSPTAKPAVEYYKKKMSKVPNGQGMATYSSALALAFYGDFDAARDELSAVQWSGLPPIYEGFQMHALAVLAILQEKNYRKAHELAVEARDLCSASKTLPGVSQSRRALDAMVDACELLDGYGTDQTATRLGEAARKLPNQAALIPAWALARYYRRVGDEGRASGYAAMVQKLAPYCGPLNETPAAEAAPH